MSASRFLLFVVSLFVISCSSQKTDPGPLNKKGQPIISAALRDGSVEFPGGTPLFMAMINLNKPALLSSAQKNEDGEYVLDQKLKAEILAEQEAMIQKLQSLSPEIKVVYRFRLALNAIAIEAPQSIAPEINELDVDLIEADEMFALPQTLKFSQDLSAVKGKFSNNSMTFIGAEEIQNKLKTVDKNGLEVSVRGQGIRVGVIDSGVDYTHAMLAGPGDPNLYKSLDPVADNAYFPNSKVVGGYDFAGSNFNPGSHLYSNHIPRPDANPLDTMGHGTHVAGTVAGLGDGQNTYNGAAPEAEIFALKVFGDGANGGTSDTVVISALEYAIDPNQDLSIDDRLHVVNLSLGGGFGKPHDLYNLAVSNVTQGGMLVIAAAGNAGTLSSVVGAPSTATDALSVAASVDDMDQNWRFPAIQFQTPTQGKLLVESVEGFVTAPTSKVGNVTGVLTYLKLANEDLTVEEASAVKGKVALIDRGIVSFDEKITRAYQAGAIGIVMVNNTEEPAFVMGGEGSYPIPGVMVTRAIGATLKAEVQKGDVVIEFKPNEMIEKPENIDTLADFSSQGPRDLDALIKPEVSAPGFAIISAAAGSGNQGVSQYGTSMSSPHIAGLAALLVQYRQDLKPRQIKSMIMNTSLPIKDKTGARYPVSRQGAGRIQGYRAATSTFALSEPSLSLGKVSVKDLTQLQKEITIENISDKDQQYVLVTQAEQNMEISVSESVVTLKPQEKKTIQVSVNLTVPELEFVEVDSFVEIYQGQERVGVIPVLAVINRTTEILINSLTVAAMNEESSAGASVEVSLSNLSQQTGQALFFNLLGKDERKDPSQLPAMSVACDLESAGYRIVEESGRRFLQVAVKLYNPLTHWNTCDIEVEFDSNNDQISDLQLNGTLTGFWPGLEAIPHQGFSSILFDSKKLRDINDEYYKQLATAPDQPPSISFLPAYVSSQPMAGFSQSTLTILFADATLLPKDFQMRVSASYNGRDNVESIDTLNYKGTDWKKISLGSDQMGFEKIPQIILVPPQSTISAQFVRGSKMGEELVGYFPRNKFIMEFMGSDSQSQVATTTYLNISTP